MEKMQIHSFSTIQSEEDHCDMAPENCFDIKIEVFNSAILKEDAAYESASSESSLRALSFMVNYDCFILQHKLKGPTRIVKSEKNAAALIENSNYKLVACLKMSKNDRGQNCFSLFTNQNLVQKQLELEQLSSSFNHHDPERDIHYLAFYSLRNESLFTAPNDSIKHRDKIKLGREVYEVRLHSGSSNITLNGDEGSILNETVYLYESSDSCSMAEERSLNLSTAKATQCKICYSKEGQHEKDILIEPCQCSGSCSKIHIECLKHWMEQKTKIRNVSNKLKSFDISKFCCEICQHTYPKYAKIQSQYICLLPRIANSEEILELRRIYPSDTNKMTHLVSLKANQSLSIGRNAENNLHLPDMSISRNHADIVRDTLGQYKLIDKNARFGTFKVLSNEEVTGNKKAVVLTTKFTYKFNICHQKDANLEKPEREQPESKNSPTFESLGYSL